MNEHETAAFAEIADTTDIQLEESLMLEHVLKDGELDDVIRAYHEYRNDLVGRLTRIASGDWSEEHYHLGRLKIAFDAGRLRYSLTDAQMLQIRKTVLLTT